MNYLTKTHTQKSKTKLLFLHACDMNKAWQTTRTHLLWYGFRLAIGTTLAWDPPGVFGALGALAFPNWLEGAWYLGAAGPSKNHKSREDFSFAHKNQVKTNSGCRTSPPCQEEPHRQSSREHWSSLSMWVPQRGLKFVAWFLLLVTSVF